MMLNFNKISVLKKAAILITFPLVFEFGVIAALVYYTDQVEHWAGLETRARELVSKLDAVQVGLSEYWLTGLTYKLNPSDSNSKELVDHMDCLEKSVFDNLKAAEDLVDKYHFDRSSFKNFRDSAELGLKEVRSIKEGVLGESIAVSTLRMRSLLIYGRKRSISSKLRMTASIDSQMKAQPRMLANSRLGVQCAIIGGILGSIVLSVIVVIALTRDIIDRLNSIMTNLVRYSAGEQLSAAVEGSDEIAQLDQEFRLMSQRVDHLRVREQALLQNTADSICSLDAESSFVQTNPAAQRMFSKEEGELAETRLIALISDEDRSRFMSQLSEAANTAGTTFVSETKLLAPSDKHCQWSIRWSDDERMYFCVGQDVTSKKALETLRRDFLNMITHDIRTPVSAMRCFLEMLAEDRYGDINDRGKLATSRLGVSLDQVFNLVNEFLEIEKLDYEAIEIETASIDIGKVIESARDLVSAIGEEKSIAVITPEALQSIRIKGNEEKLVRVIQNLLSNALRYSPQGSSIMIEVEEKGKYAEVKVTNQGPSIPAELIDRVFEKYTQAEKMARKGTTGLGLAICKKIVEKHGGQIGVNSDELSGTCFWFTVPLADPN